MSSVTLRAEPVEGVPGDTAGRKVDRAGTTPPGATGRQIGDQPRQGDTSANRESVVFTDIAKLVDLQKLAVT